MSNECYCVSQKLVEKGTLIEFRLHGERRLAVAERQEGKTHWIVVDEKGQSHTIHPRQMTYKIAGESYKPAQISSFLQEVQRYLDPTGLEVAWELLVEDGTSVTDVEMASVLFSDKSAPLCYAAYYLLSEDRLYFKQKGDRYEPRPATQVAELKHQIEVEKERLLRRQEFVERVQKALSGEQVKWERRERQRLEAIEKYAALLTDVVRAGLNQESLNRAYPPPAPVLETMSELGRPGTPQAAFQLLVDLGLWSPHENLYLRRSQIPVHFPDKVIEVAKQYAEFAPNDSDEHRLDLTHLKVYTIDDESTKEIDDGLSMETLADGRQRLWIHIADPSRLVSPGDELDLEARRRTTTLYLPTGMIPMFPPSLATGPMSLVQGKICWALSFGVLLDEKGAVEDYCISASLIKPTYRLTYDDVDEMLQLGIQAEPEITAIASWAKRRQSWRQSQGSINIHMPEAMIKVNGDEIIIEILEDSPARQLVAEMMILTGEVAAHYGKTHNIPLPFRSQPQPELPSEEELLQLPAGPVRFCAMRGCMPRSEMSLTPGRHAGLGLETYAQVTSPIRRYSDLLAHFQIKAHLRGEPTPFSAQELQEVMLGIGTASQEARLVERQTNRYWGLEYLRRHGDQVWQALMLRWLREDDRLGLILLEDLGLELAMRFTHSVALGDRLEVRVSHADPRQDVIQFRQLIDQEAQPAGT
nr:ribonuclease R family protein [Coleofasciculus sp. FACHB-T130]